MNTWLMSYYTGPVIVDEVARKAREAGIKVACVGTEHVYFNVDAWNIQGARIAVDEALKGKHGSDFGVKFQWARAVEK